MKKILLIITIFASTFGYSQKTTFEQRVREISKNIEKITKTQKDSLKIKVQNIKFRIEKGEISQTEASKMKKAAASYHANKIEEQVSIQEQLIQQLVQDKTNGKIAFEEAVITTEDDDNTFTIGNAIFRLNIAEGDQKDRDKNRKKRWVKKGKKQRSTTTQFVFALGVNNALNNHRFGSLNDSKYKFWGSRFCELGWTWKTRMSKKPSNLYIKYGFSFLWNNLRLEDNQYHVKNGNITEIKTFSQDLSESRLRHVQLNFPMHFEWDFSKSKKEGDFVRNRTHKGLRLGVGGFLGFKLGTRQYLEYKNMERVDIEEIQFDNFNMNRFNYGLSAYLGYKSNSFYVKYDLNPLFKGKNSRNISMGVRFDWN